MFEILHLYRIPEGIISAIRDLYTDTSSSILSSDDETELFSIIAVILQGDTLAPFLFIIVVDYVLRMSVDTIFFTGYITWMCPGCAHVFCQSSTTVVWIAIFNFLSSLI